MSITFVRQRIHLVWGTKLRQPWLDPPWRPRLFGYIGGIVQKEGGRLLSAGASRDHLHLYVEFPATLALAALVNTIKSTSSRWIHQNFPHRREFHWQAGYAAFSVNPQDDRKLQEYIRGQELHHRQVSFPDEFLALLDGHGIVYDKRSAQD